MERKDSWDGVLEEGEEIVWQGRPATNLQWKDFLTLIVVLGILAAFFHKPVIQLYQYGGSLESYLKFGGLFALIAGIAAFGLFKSYWEGRRIWYTLTDRRAFIARISYFGGRKMDEYWLNPNRHIYIDNFDNPPSVIFEVKEYNSGGKQKVREIGFKRIAEAEKVLELMKHHQSRWNDMEV